MTVLTWRDTAQTDFGDANALFRTGADSVNKGFATLQATLGDIERRGTEKADNAVLANLLQYNDPTKLRRANEQGVLLAGINPAMISSKTYETLLGRAATLDKDIEFANQAEANQNARVRNEETQQFLDKNRGLINGYRTFMDAGRRDLAEGLIADHPELAQGMRTGAYATMLDDAAKTYSTRQNQNSDKFSYDTSVLSYEEGRKLEELNADIGANGLDAIDQYAYIRDNQPALIQKYGQNVVARAMNRLAGNRDLGAGGVGGGAGGGTGIGGRNLYDVILGDRGAGQNEYGFALPKPATQMTIGEIYDYQRNVMVPETAKRGVGGGQGSSAVGAYQIVSKTMERIAPQVLGANWRNIQFTPEVQDKLGKALFDARPVGGDLHDEWEGLPKGTIKTKDMTWDTMKNKITQNESGGIADPRGAGVVASSFNRNVAMADQTLGAAQAIQAAYSDTRGPREIANDLVAKNPAWKGADVNNVARLIEKYQAKFPKANAAVVGTIITRNLGGTDFLNQSWVGGGGIDRLFGDGIPIDYNTKAIEKELQFASNPEAVANSVRSYDIRSQNSQQNSQLQAQVAQLRQSIANRQEQGARYRVRVDTSVDEARLAQMEAALQQAAGADLTGAAAGLPEDVRRNPRTARPTTAPARSAPAKNPMISEAQGIMRLGGEIRKRQEAKFQDLYGITPAQAMQGVAAPARGSSVTVSIGSGAVTRDTLRAAAQMAVAAGPRGIAAFKKQYGSPPQSFLK